MSFLDSAFALDPVTGRSKHKELQHPDGKTVTTDGDDTEEREKDNGDEKKSHPFARFHLFI
ncbi:hypothetical protein GCM10007086_06890 [Photobacterium aphoticum]|nr:hypothetical protein GCM10007086_06890 [Photobacterium aphoticum]